MSVENLATKAVYSTNGVVKEFDIPFQFTNPNQVAVYITDMSLGETEKISSNIEVNEYLQKVIYPLTDAPLDEGWQITIIRETELTQDSNITQSGWFQPRVVMDMCDKLTLVAQEHAEKLERTIKYSINQVPTETEAKGFLSIIEAARDNAIVARDSALAIKDHAVAVYDLINLAQTQVYINIGEKETESLAALDLKLSTTMSEIDLLLTSIYTLESNVQIYHAAVERTRISIDETAFILDQKEAAFTSALASANSIQTAVNLTLNDCVTTLNQVLGLKSDVVLLKADALGHKNDANASKLDAAESAASALLALNAINDAIGGVGGGDLGVVGAPHGSRTEPQLIEAETQLLPWTGKGTQVFFIAGLDGEVVVTEAEFIKTLGMFVGERVVLIGTSDTNTVYLKSSVNLIMNGDAELSKNRSIEFDFIGNDGVHSSFQESRRNF